MALVHDFLLIVIGEESGFLCLFISVYLCVYMYSCGSTDVHILWQTYGRKSQVLALVFYFFEIRSTSHFAVGAFRLLLV